MDNMLTFKTSFDTGLVMRRGYFDDSRQRELVTVLRDAVRCAPLFTPTLPNSGKEMKVRMTNLGDLGWVTDRDRGYRYQATHPRTGCPWPDIPTILLDLWRHLVSDEPPDCCLVNWYGPEARLGLHQDKDEESFDYPIVSVSLGAACVFAIGGLKRTDPVERHILQSGDVVMFGGPKRLAYHAVERVYPHSSELLRSAGRINLTMRRVRA